MQTVFRTPYNYVAVTRSSFRSPLVYMERKVRVADTDIKQDNASFSNVNSTSEKSYFTNSEVPIKVFGNNILSTPFNPLSQRTHDAALMDSPSVEEGLSNQAPVTDIAAAAVTTE